MDNNATPVALFELDANDDEFHLQDQKERVPRFIIEQIDGDRFFFPTREAAERFMDVHGMIPVSDTVMAKLRTKS